MRMVLTGNSVSDQEHTLRFSTELLGFVERADFPEGEFRWSSVVSAEAT